MLVFLIEILMKTKMLINNEYSSAAVNQTPTALDWGKNGLICYGAANAVAIVKPDVSCVAKFLI